MNLQGGAVAFGSVVVRKRRKKVAKDLLKQNDLERKVSWAALARSSFL